MEFFHSLSVRNLRAIDPVTAKPQAHQQLVNVPQVSNHHVQEQEPTDEETESEAPALSWPRLVHNNIGAQCPCPTSSTPSHHLHDRSCCCESSTTVAAAIRPQRCCTLAGFKGHGVERFLASRCRSDFCQCLGALSGKV